MRVAVIFDNFGPYHLARLGAASRRMDLLALEVRAQSLVYGWDAAAAPTEFTRKVLMPPGGSRRVTARAMRAAIDAAMLPFAPDAVALAGWSFLDALSGLSWAIAAGVPAVVMSESNRYDAERLSAAERLKRSIAGAFAAGLCGGDAAKGYLVELGLPEDGIFLGYDVVDNAFFATHAEQHRRGAEMPDQGAGVPLSEQWRGRYFLASARFIAVKNLSGLLVAYSAYRQRAAASAHEAWPLVLLGDGPLRDDLERQRHAAGLDDCVHMPGFKQYNDLPGYYGTAGAFVHASTMEPWGLVVNEAMASGLPVAVSNRCGCAEMLVADDVNGLIFDPYDTTAIATAFWRLATHPEPQTLAQASRQRIAGWGPERFAQGLQDACEFAVRAPGKSPGVAQKMLLRVAGELRARQ